MAQWEDYGNEAIQSLYPTLRDGVDYVWGCRNPGDTPSLIVTAPFLTIEMAAVQARANRLMGLDPYATYTPAPDPMPSITSLIPNSAQVGAAALTLEVHGYNFDPGTVIVFNNGDEPTTYVDGTQVTTGVDPTTATGPYTVPVQVKNGTAISGSALFTFTE